MTNIERNMIYCMLIDYYGVEPQLEMVQEECAELIQAISKYKRNKSTKTLANIEEEIADVKIMLEQLILMLPISPYNIQTEIDYKLIRQQQRIKEDK